MFVMVLVTLSGDNYFALRMRSDTRQLDSIILMQRDSAASVISGFFTTKIIWSNCMFDNIMEVRALRKEFGSSVAVENVSFDVRKGEILGLLGANGAGKSTTLFTLMGLITPTSGTIRVFDKDLQTNRVEILQRMNFASAYQFLPYNLKVWENLHVFGEIYRVENGKRKAAELLDMFELTHLKNKMTGALSSGEQTRLNLCKALLSDPELLLLDEPTASLDPDLADKVRKILLEPTKTKWHDYHQHIAQHGRRARVMRSNFVYAQRQRYSRRHHCRNTR